MIALLEPLFQGEWAPLGETLDCTPRPPDGAVKVADLLTQPELLADILARHARRWRSTEMRAVASAWSLSYLWALLPPVVAAASVLQHGFPVDPARMWLSLDEDGEPLRFHILDEGHPWPGTDAATRFAPLVWTHLLPLVTALNRQARVPAKILWGNAARHIESVLDEALILTGQAPHIAEDLAHLLHCPSWPGHARNPLQGVQRQVIHIDKGQTERITLHQQCCLYYLLPDEGYCGACPLAPQYRKLKDAAPPE